MKNFLILSFVAAAFAAVISSCGSSGDTVTPGYTPTKVRFQGDGLARYDLFKVDTPDASGNNPDQLIQDLTGIEESVVDTAIPFPNNIMAIKTVFATPIPDTNYYYQDKEGNLYRYNYGFSMLNNYDFLITAIGQKVDVGWVLIAKPGAPAGTTWIGKKDSIITSAYGKLYLLDEAVAMNDTTFRVSNGRDTTITAIHVRHNVTGYNEGNLILGTIIVDTYFSPELGMAVMDFFHHSTIQSVIKLPQNKAQGSLKVMTFFRP